jgi:ketosteroid isomerase-like protein
MKRSLAMAAWLLLAAVCFASGPTVAAVGPSQNDRAEQEVRQADAGRIKAMLASDVAALDRILADDLVYTHSTGAVDDKKQYLASIKSGDLTYLAYEPLEAKIRVYGNVAIINGRAQVKARSKGQDTSALLRYTAVYVKRDGRWQFASWQSTRLQQ